MYFFFYLLLKTIAISLEITNGNCWSFDFGSALYLSQELGIIRSVKVNYRKLLMRKITESLNENAEKKYKANVLDAPYFLRQSWHQVSKSTIEKCFQKVGFPST